MRYALQTIWFDRRRYLAGVLAVHLSTVLIALQFGIMIGLVSMVSVPIDHSRAQIWVASRNTPSCDLGLHISTDWTNRLRMQPEIVATDECIQSFSFWKTSSGAYVLVIIVGCNVGENSLGPVEHLTAEQRLLLTESRSVVLDGADARRLEIDAVGQTGEIIEKRVRVVGFTNDMGSMTAPYIFCSLTTARDLLAYYFYDSSRATYLLASCREPSDVPQVVERLQQFETVSTYSANEFSWKSRKYWLNTAKTGIAVWFVAVLGLVVGLLVTSQTLYSATIASTKELAILRALGAPRWRMGTLVLQQSVFIGVLGVVSGIPAAYLLAQVANVVGTRAVLPIWLVAATAAVTLSMALLSGLFALRSLRHTEPAQLLR